MINLVKDLLLKLTQRLCLEIIIGLCRNHLLDLKR